jgi:hypothetical protein
MGLIVDSAVNLKVDDDIIRNFYLKNWSKPIAICNKKFYNWQFLKLNSKPNKNFSVVVIDDKNQELAGIMGLSERNFLLNNQIKKGAELTTWIIAQKYRGLNVAFSIMSYLKTHYDILIGLGITDLALSIYRMAGFRYLNAIPRFVKICNIKSFSKNFTLDFFSKRLCSYKTNNNLKYSIFEISNSDENIPNYYSCFKNFNLFSRSIEYLKWRYLDHPVYKYKVFVISSLDYNHQALVAFRIEDSIENFKILHIMDCIGDEKAISLALNFIDKFCEDNNIDVADFFCTATKINKFFLEAGWFSALDDKFFQFPHLFHPVKFMDPPTTSMVYWSKNDFLEMCDFSKLYITKQDCDFDRPVFQLCNNTEKSSNNEQQ